MSEILCIQGISRHGFTFRYMYVFSIEQRPIVKIFVCLCNINFPKQI